MLLGLRKAHIILASKCRTKEPSVCLLVALFLFKIYQKNYKHPLILEMFFLKGSLMSLGHNINKCKSQESSRHGPSLCVSKIVNFFSVNKLLLFPPNVTEVGV